MAAKETWPKGSNLRIERLDGEVEYLEVDMVTPTDKGYLLVKISNMRHICFSYAGIYKWERRLSK